VERRRTPPVAQSEHEQGRGQLLDLSLKFPNLAVRVRKQLPQQTRFFRTVPIKHR
jgi:hypothetical protein